MFRSPGHESGLSSCCWPCVLAMLSPWIASLTYFGVIARHETPQNALQALIARTRKALGPPGRQVLTTRDPGYLLAVARDQVDILRFEDLVAQARKVKDSGAPQEIQRLELQ